MTPSTFARGRHLGFTALALLHAPLATTTVLLAALVPIHPWTPQVEALDRLLPLVFVTAVAWLALDRFDTGSGVTLLPRRWADVGWFAGLGFVAQELVRVLTLARQTPAQIDALASAWPGMYADGTGELMLGWLLVGVVATATAEELVHRALLLRALEGYLDRGSALLVHAVVFELTHEFVYGYGFRGGAWFVAALVYGHAFQRTRSLAVPLAMHVGSLLLFHGVLAWRAS